MRIWFCQWLGLGTHLFVKVSRQETAKWRFQSSNQASTCYYQSNYWKVEAILLSALPKDTTKAKLPDYNRPTSLYNWRTFLIVWFFFQSVLITSNTLTLSEISFFYLFFVFCFFHIASWFNHRPNSCHRATDTTTPSVHRCLAKIVANWKVLSNFILVQFSNFSATKAN